MLLFGMSGRSVQEIRGILEKEYGFKMSDKLKKGVENMCNLAQGLIIENQALGRQIGKKRRNIFIEKSNGDSWISKRR